MANSVNPDQTVQMRITPGSRQSKMLTLATNVDQKSLETVLSIVICRQSGQHCF